ncbi:hypothetical protein ACG7TL_005738 [Trametes sanguinea]
MPLSRTSVAQSLVLVKQRVKPGLSLESEIGAAQPPASFLLSGHVPSQRFTVFKRSMLQGLLLPPVKFVDIQSLKGSKLLYAHPYCFYTCLYTILTFGVISTKNESEETVTSTMHLNESVLCATAPAASGSGPGTLALHDIQTGTSLASWKQSSAALHCTAIVQSRDGQGGFMLAAQQDKSILNVYSFQKAMRAAQDQLALKIVLPEKLTAIAVDPKGKYCAGATAQGRIASGIMYNSWDAHYRQINVLRFTQDAAALLAGSEDSGVSVWLTARFVLVPISELWDPASKTLLTTFYFPRPITCITWDPTERLFFAASADGSIHQVNLFRQREDKYSRAAMEAVGGAGVSDIIRINEIDPKDAKKRLISVGESVTAMAISLTGAMLLAGTTSGLIHVYDIASHQQLRTLSSHKGMAITHLSTMLRPPDLVGHTPVGTFFSYSREELIKDHAFFVQPSAVGPEAAGVSLQSRVSELEGEVTRLREQLGKAKGINDVMWETVVQRMVSEGKEESEKKQGSTEQDLETQAEGGGRRRKRNRT